MDINLEQAVDFLRQRDDFLVLAHMDPDGDTLGSAFALCGALQRLGKRARVDCSDKIDKKYNYMFNGIENQRFKIHTVVAVDVADAQLLGEKMSVYAETTDLCIDHHAARNLFARRTLRDASAAATGEIIFSLIQQLDVPFDQAIAACIYTAVATDTGCFKFSNTTSRSHFIAASMIEQGIDHAAINREMFDVKTRSRLEIERLVLKNIEFFLEDRCAVICITDMMRKNACVSESDLDGITALPRQIEGVLAGITLREKEDGTVRISVRTVDGVNAAGICAKMGGGGHKNAAGCQFKGSMEEAKTQMVAFAAQELDS